MDGSAQLLGGRRFLNNTTHNAEKCQAVSHANDNSDYSNTADKYKKNIMEVTRKIVNSDS